MADFLLELFSEEIPAGLQSRAVQDLERLILQGFGAEDLTWGEVSSFATPRRLSLIVKEVPSNSPDFREERKGPRLGAPEKAISGFLKSVGLQSLEQCKIGSDKKGEYYVATIERPGKTAQEIIKQLVPDVVRKFPWSKSMRWGDGSLRWVRPLHRIVCLFDDEVVSFEVDGISSGNETLGHRFLAPERIVIDKIDEYKSKLEAAFVMLNANTRQEAIIEQAKKLANSEKLNLVEDQGLLSETCGLVEWPMVLLGIFDEDYLAVPPEVLITSMKKHQKCFSLVDRKNDKLANRFLLVSNLIAADGGEAVVHGNERVIRARLADARFFWDQDRRKPLEDQTEKLDGVIFHEKLGRQSERVSRIVKLARVLATYIDAELEVVTRAAKLCKADLVSEIVGEFPDLQGLMGYYLALEQGESEEIAFAIGEHYKPAGPNDDIPERPVSTIVALADKLDTIAGFWAIDEKPTGSKDPYALRRAALGIIRLVLENEIRLPLRSVFDKAIDNYRDVSGASDLLRKMDDRKLAELTKDLLSFFAERLKIYLRDKGVRHDVIEAVITAGDREDLLMIVKRIRAVEECLVTSDGINLIAGIKRAENILKIEEKKDNRSYDGSIEPQLLKEMDEKLLYAAINRVAEDTRKAVQNEDFKSAMQSLSELRDPVDSFFEHVIVNTDDPSIRENRLNLLSAVRSIAGDIADYSVIMGGER